MQLIIDGHLYTRSQIRERIIIWHCSRQRSGCKSRISTLRGEPGTAYSFRADHNHESKFDFKNRDIKILKVAKLKVVGKNR